MAGRTTLIGTLAAALVSGGALVAAAPVAAAPDDRSPRAGQRLLERTLPGPSARRQLGVQGLQRAAEANDMAAAKVAELLEDRTSRLTQDGRLYYADTAHADTAPADTADTADQPSADAAPVAASAPLDQTFALHSRPTSTRTIFLDFDGASVSNTWWNESFGGSLPASTVAAFSLDGDRSTFNDAERRLIQEIWARVAEDFAPFDVDVTTAEPAAGGLVRTSSSDTTYGTQVLFAPGRDVASALCNANCSGVAWVDVFDRTMSGKAAGPAWVFTDLTGTAGYRLTEVASHEAGHTLSLQHDGTSTASYFQGRSPWGPIMGSSRYALSQWNPGDYSGANQDQDDVLAISQSGAPALADDHGDEVGSGATPLVAQADGLIGNRSDRDVFSVTHASCSPTLTVRAAEVGANLDARLRILDGSGSEVATADPALTQTASGQLAGTDATLTLPSRPAGTFYVEVDGVGQPGYYSDYGSLGRYTVSLTGCSGTEPNPPAPPNPPNEPTSSPDPTTENDDRTGATELTRPGTIGVGRAYSGALGGVRTARATWPAAGVAGLTGYRVVALKVRRSGKVIRRIRTTLPAGATLWEPQLPRGRYQFQVAAINDAGVGRLSGRSNRVSAR